MKDKRVVFMGTPEFAVPVLENLIEHYYTHIDELPGIYKEIAEKEGIKRAVADYISGMSDDYCLNTFNSIFVPKLVIY